MDRVSEELLRIHAEIRTTRAMVRLQSKMRKEEREAERKANQTERLGDLIIEFRNRKHSFKERYSKWQK